MSLRSFGPDRYRFTESAPEGSPRNVWRTTIDAVDRSDGRVRVQLGTPLPIAVEVTPAGFDALATEPDGEVWASVKASEIVVQPA